MLNVSLQISDMYSIPVMFDTCFMQYIWYLEIAQNILFPRHDTIMHTRIMLLTLSPYSRDAHNGGVNAPPAVSLLVCHTQIALFTNKRKCVSHRTQKGLSPRVMVGQGGGGGGIYTPFDNSVGRRGRENASGPGT